LIGKQRLDGSDDDDGGTVEVADAPRRLVLSWGGFEEQPVGRRRASSGPPGVVSSPTGLQPAQVGWGSGGNGAGEEPGVDGDGAA